MEVILCVLPTTFWSLHSPVVGQPPEFIEEPAEALGFRKVVFEVDVSGERDNLTLNCNASGDPVPNITWFRDDGIEVDTVFVQNGTLFIESITEGDYASRDGVNYSCTATNSFGTIRSRTATVFYACEFDSLATVFCSVL